MKLLFINRVYPPAEGATGFLLQELAEAFAGQGHEVSVVTSAAGVAGEKIPRTGIPGREEGSFVKIWRVAGLPFTRASHWKRALSYLSLYPAFFLSALRLPKQDIVITLTDPPLQLALGPFLRLFKGCKLVHWAQDIYPELAEELGVLPHGGLAARWLKRFSTSALRRYDLVVAVGRCMREKLIQRGVAADRIAVIPNWAQETFLQGGNLAEEIQKFRSIHGLNGKFVVMYSGNFGLAHDFDAILQAVPILAREEPRIQFVFVGGGPRLNWLKEQLGGYSTVQFLPFQPKEMLGISLGAADLHLASMKEELNGLVVPSKIYGILAAGKPCVFLGPEQSEAGKFIRDNGCGTQVAPKDSGGFAATLKKYGGNPSLCDLESLNAIRALKKVEFAVALRAFVQEFGRLQS